MYSVFLDASKAFDRTNHSLLFKKLISRKVPVCWVRLLASWYGNQQMLVKWGNTFSEPFHVTNGVRQGGVLSPYLYALYLDELSEKLNLVRAGCCIGSTCLNHLMFADDICLFAPTLKGMQCLLDVCCAYAWNMRLSSL